MSLENKVLGFVGGGNMARAIVDGILKKDLVKTSQIIVSSISEFTLEKWRKSNIYATVNNEEVITKADIIFLAVKPHQLDSAFAKISSKVFKSSSSKLFVSILAGIPSQIIYDKLVKFVHLQPRVIRVMPNTPAMICEGCSAISFHSSAIVDDIIIVQKVFSSIGKCEVVPENLISAITGLIGSGPAYIFTIIEALSDAGVKQGLTRGMSTVFAAQTILGAAKMVLETQKHPAQLKDEVCSAGGTTIYGLHALEKGGIRAIIMNAVEAAAQRGEEIARLSEQ